MYTSTTNRGILADTRRAANVTARLWSAVQSTGFQHLTGAALLRNYLPHEVLGDLPLPVGDNRPSTQTVALVNGRQFERTTEAKTLMHRYDQAPRTRVYEGIDVRSPGWYSLVCCQLARLARCRVPCSMYESNRADAGLVAHVDAWHGLILQMTGEKCWNLRTIDGLTSISTQPGDLLLLSEGVSHSVSTPSYSVHLVFALITSEPL